MCDLEKPERAVPLLFELAELRPGDADILFQLETLLSGRDDAIHFIAVQIGL